MVIEKKPGRPKKSNEEKKQREVIYIDPDLLKWANNEAVKDKRTLSQWIAILLERKKME